MKYSVWILMLVPILCLVRGDRRNECPQRRYTYSTVEFQDRCFQLYDREKEWVGARDYCHQFGGRLLMINDAETLEFVRNTLRDSGWHQQSLWIGLNDRTTADDWNWLTFNRGVETDLTFSNWDSGYPEGEAWHEFFAKECAYMTRGVGSWYWRNAVCNTRSKRFKFICEYQLPPVATTVPQSDTSITPETTPGIPATTQNELPTTGVVVADPDSEVAGSVFVGPSTNGVHPTTDLAVADSTSRMPGSVFGGPSKESVHDKHDYLPNNAPQSQSKVPRYVIILSFAAGVLIVVIIVIVITVRHRKREKKSAENLDVYLTTCEVNGQPRVELGGACGGGMDPGIIKCSPAESRSSRQALPNEYDTSLRCSMANVAGTGTLRGGVTLDLGAKPPTTEKVKVVQSEVPREAEGELAASTEECHVCGTLKRKGPSLAGSLARGTLPALPTDGGYEVPVSLQPASMATLTAGSGYTQGAGDAVWNKPGDPYSVPNKPKAENKADTAVYVQDMYDGDDTTADSDSGIYHEIPERKPDVKDVDVYQSIA